MAASRVVHRRGARGSGAHRGWVSGSCVPPEEGVEEVSGCAAWPAAADVVHGVVQGEGCGGVAGAYVQARLGTVAEIDRGVGGSDRQYADLVAVEGGEVDGEEASRLPAQAGGEQLQEVAFEAVAVGSAQAGVVVSEPDRGACVVDADE